MDIVAAPGHRQRLRRKQFHLVELAACGASTGRQMAHSPVFLSSTVFLVPELHLLPVSAAICLDQNYFFWLTNCIYSLRLEVTFV